MSIPAPLPTAAARRRRRRLAAVTISVGLVATVVFTAITLRAVTAPGADVRLGDDTFRVGDARALARRIAADDYPLLFQDLRGGSLDLFVDHERGRPSDEGWRAFEAHAPRAPRRCQLEWRPESRKFVDPCDGAQYAADGTGLRQFAVTVRAGVVAVDLGRAPR